jgi:hypothetical protein
MSNTKIFLALVIFLAIGLKFPPLSPIAIPLLGLVLIVGLFKATVSLFSLVLKLLK